MSAVDCEQWSCRKEQWNKQDDDVRAYYDIDYARIVHSASFRRLQGKTQILNLGDSDFYRTRLTHSIEVSQIAEGIVQQLKQKYSDNKHLLKYLPPPKLVATLGAAHDLGHPPFGHGGEIALNYCMRDKGGFEGNGQTLRLLTKLEDFSKDNGSNLSRRTLLGCLKYPRKYSDLKNCKLKPKSATNSIVPALIDRGTCIPPKCYLDTEKAVVDWLLKFISCTDKGKFLKIIKKRVGTIKPCITR